MSLFQAVVVPSGLTVRVQPRRWIMTWWWKKHSRTQPVTLVGEVLDVVDLAGPGGLAAPAGPFAVLGAEADGFADVGGDGAAVADVQRQARGGQPRVELLPPQVASYAAGS